MSICRSCRIGSDEEALYVVDYGANGRQGAHESVTVLRIAVPNNYVRPRRPCGLPRFCPNRFPLKRFGF